MSDPQPSNNIEGSGELHGEMDFESLEEEDGELEVEVEENGNEEDDNVLDQARAELRSPDGESKFAFSENSEVEREVQEVETRPVVEEPNIDEENFSPPSLANSQTKLSSVPLEEEDGNLESTQSTNAESERLLKLKKKKERQEAQKLKEKKALQHFLFDKMNRENEVETLNSTLNARKLRKKWVEVLRSEKVTQLKKEIEILSDLHNRQVNRKDEVLNELWKDLCQSEKHFKNTVRAHKNHVNDLLELQKKKIEKFEKMSRTYLESLENEFAKEFAEMEDMHKERVSEVREVTMEMIHRENKKEFELDKEFEIQKKAIKNKYTRLFHVMGIQMKKLIRSKEKIMEEESRDIGRPIQKKYSDYVAKRDENSDLSEKIKYQRTVIKRLEDSLSVWKAKWLNNLREFQRRNTNLNAEIKKLRKHFHTAKRKMVSQREEQKKKLTSLVKANNKANAVLDARIAQAKRLIELYHLNRKHESKTERVIENFVEKDEHPDVAELSAYSQSEDGQVSLDYIILMNSIKLGRFFTKYNKVLMEEKAEKEKQEYLLDENRRLKAMLKKYLDGIAVNEEILAAENNTLLMVKQITPQEIGDKIGVYQ